MSDDQTTATVTAATPHCGSAGPDRDAAAIEPEGPLERMRAEFLAARERRLVTRGIALWNQTEAAYLAAGACVTTPPLVKSQAFSVTFPKTGNDKLVCLVHENMTGVVHVLDAASVLPFDQADYDAQAADAGRDLLADRGDSDTHLGHHGRMLTPAIVAGTGEVTANGGGSMTRSILRFSDEAITIHVGDTVEWTNEDPVTPHTITFGLEPGDPMPPSANVTIDADGARHVTMASTGGSAHSGFIVSAPQERVFLPQAALGATRFRVTFTHAGSYAYICALHDDLGMKGVIIVRP